MGLGCQRNLSDLRTADAGGFRGVVRYKPFDDVVEFDELVALALAETVVGPATSPLVKTQLMARIANSAPAPAGFSLRFVTAPRAR